MSSFFNFAWNDRNREIFRVLVESYLSTGDPIGSKTLTHSLSENLSSATIRNVMKNLESLGLLDSPHISAGRIPTHIGLRLFVDGFLEVDSLAGDLKNKIDDNLFNSNNLTQLLERAGHLLSNLTQSASLVLSPKIENTIKHIELIPLSSKQTLVILVTEDGQVENRLFRSLRGQTPATLREAANFLNSILSGHTISELKSIIESEISEYQNDLNTLSHSLISRGLAVWSKDDSDQNRLIVHGRSYLLSDSGTLDDIERTKQLFDDLEHKKEIVEFLRLAEEGEGVRIFIGCENKLFSLSGSSLVVSPYIGGDRRVIGALGVIGPTRLNYGRVIPIVNYTAQLISRIIQG